jgi:alkylation response protein AidB-like acyl-CoA dehydrogenase
MSGAFPSVPPDSGQGEDETAFRVRVRAFIDEQAPAIRVRRGHRAPEEGDIAALRDWTAALYREGFYGADWPPEWGGTAGVDPFRQAIVVEELARANAPTPIGAGYLASRAVLAHGTEEQKRRFLPRIRSGEDLWCQLFSEPGAGSDLASLQTRAARDGDTFVVSGQKVWTTNGHHADLGFLLARTEPGAPKHAGISAFALDMHAPGVTVRPLREITGTADFNEVFLDAVRVPGSAMIGRPGQGWAVATEALGHERLANTGLPIRLQLLLEDLLTLAAAKATVNDPVLRQALARSGVSVRLSRLVSNAAVSRIRSGQAGPVDGPINKLLSSETNVDLTDLSISVAGLHGLLDDRDPAALDNGTWVDDFLYARALPIAGGTNEVMRNVIAERGLGLPREPRPGPGS